MTHSYLAVTSTKVNAVTWSDNTSDRGLKSHHRLEITGIEEALTRTEDEYTNEALEIHISSHIFSRIRARCRNYMVGELLFELYPKHAMQPSQLCGTREEQTKKKAPHSCLPNCYCSHSKQLPYNSPSFAFKTVFIRVYALAKDFRVAHRWRLILGTGNVWSRRISNVVCFLLESVGSLLACTMLLFVFW